MRTLLYSGTAVAFALAAPASADEGLWTFDNPPTARIKAAYGWAPDQKWLDTVRQSSVRLTGGCSGSVVSGQGLVLTNHHCIVGCAQDLSTDKADYVENGILVDDRRAERTCPGQQAEIVTLISDVSARVKTAIGTSTGLALVKARDAATAAIETESCTDAATLRCQVVTLYGGGQYKLYKYRKYSD
ncbi:MAG TPA: S46 family peptidase, partial [Sphingomicrobium sp.]